MLANQAKWLIIASSLTVLLAGCGGSDSPEKTPVPEDAEPEPKPLRLFENGPFPVAGLAETGPVTPGRYFYSPRGETGSTAGFALVSGSGRTLVSTGTGDYFARIDPDNNGTFEDLITQNDGNSRTLNLTGTLNPSNANDVNIAVIEPDSGASMESGTLTLQTPSGNTNAAELPATYRRLEGDQGEVPGNIWDITLSADGTMSGSDQSLCQINGAYEAAPGTTHLYETEFKASGCVALDGVGAADRNGTYKGLILHDRDMIEMFATNGANDLVIRARDTESPFADVEFRSEFTLDDYQINNSVLNTIDTGLYAYQEIATDTETAPEDLETGRAIISPTGRVVIQTQENFQIRTRIDGFDTRGTLDDQIDNLVDNATLRITGVVNSEPGAPMKVLGNIESDGTFAARFELTEMEPANGVSPVTLADLTGTYSDVDPVGQFTTTITIASDGTLTGGDEACIFNGKAVALDSVATPVFEARFTAAQCAARPGVPAEMRNGTFNLIGVLEDNGAGSKTLRAFFASSFYLAESKATN